MLNDRNAVLARNYTFVRQTVRRQFNSAGGEESRHSEEHEITILFSQPHSRLIARDGRPLLPKEEKKEQDKLAKTFAQRKNETEAEKQKRLADDEQRRERARAFLREVPEAYDFRLLGEEALQGRYAWIIEAAPRPGYRPRDPRARILPKVRGRLWIDKAESQWVKADLEAIDTLSFAGFLFRLGKGSRLEFEQVKINDEVWLPKRLYANISARLALIKKFQGDVELTYSNYRKFRSDAEIVLTDPPHGI